MSAPFASDRLAPTQPRVIRTAEGYEYIRPNGASAGRIYRSAEAAWRDVLGLPPAPRKPLARGWNLYRWTPCGTLAILVMTARTRDALFPTAQPGDQIQRGLAGPVEAV